jgi:hypothetical protein
MVPIMQEFSSISVSSYEAGALADRLNEQARDGWDVVAIVPTGSTITAYLSREAAEQAEAPAAEWAPEPVVVPAEPVDTAPAPADDTSSWTALAESAAADTAHDSAFTPEPVAAEPISVPEISVSEVSLPEVSAPEPYAAEPEPVNEPAGWAVAPEAASSAPAIDPTPADPMNGFGASAPAYDPAAQAAAEAEAAAAAAAAQAAAEAEAAAAAAASQQASSGAAPAGWYADPSSRYELRYWDGSQWTEHVSRAGQQFTDPPVA